MPVAIIYSQKMADRIAGVIIKRVISPSSSSNNLAWSMGHALRRVPRLDKMVAQRVKKALAKRSGKGK
jgi:hypothetical protein